MRRLAPQAATVLAAVLAALLAACGTSRHARDDEPTIATLKDRRVTVVKDTIGRVDPDRAIAAYRALAEGAADASQRPEVLRRLADLEVEKVEARIADGRAAGTKADWQDAVRQYRALLEAYPNVARAMTACSTSLRVRTSKVAISTMRSWSSIAWSASTPLRRTSAKRSSAAVSCCSPRVPTRVPKTRTRACSRNRPRGRCTSARST